MIDQDDITDIGRKFAEWATFGLAGLGLGLEYAGKTAYQATQTTPNGNLTLRVGEQFTKTPEWVTEVQHLSKLAFAGTVICAISWLYLEWREKDD